MTNSLRVNFDGKKFEFINLSISRYFNLDYHLKTGR